MKTKENICLESVNVSENTRCQSVGAQGMRLFVHQDLCVSLHFASGRIKQKRFAFLFNMQGNAFAVRCKVTKDYVEKYKAIDSVNQ